MWFAGASDPPRVLKKLLIADNDKEQEEQRGWRDEMVIRDRGTRIVGGKKRKRREGRWRRSGPSGPSGSEAAAEMNSDTTGSKAPAALSAAA